MHFPLAPGQLTDNGDSEIQFADAYSIDSEGNASSGVPGQDFKSLAASRATVTFATLKTPRFKFAESDDNEACLLAKSCRRVHHQPTEGNLFAGAWTNVLKAVTDKNKPESEEMRNKRSMA